MKEILSGIFWGVLLLAIMYFSAALLIEKSNQQNTAAIETLQTENKTLVDTLLKLSEKQSAGLPPWLLALIIICLFFFAVIVCIALISAFMVRSVHLNARRDGLVYYAPPEIQTAQPTQQIEYNQPEIRYISQ